ncbi:hypothetical protein DVS28_b0472 (plasmid) [Euzebya pacifica]|uniref:Uncharacterized protein n=1 Tax=Euzebya pacifica TaxID=1608957 RepID=A0A346Y6W5_9ACTN|nr:hypothetical protein DVS28_b0472 [Euzebya pacifica]
MLSCHDPRDLLATMHSRGDAVRVLVLVDGMTDARAIWRHAVDDPDVVEDVLLALAAGVPGR